MVKEMRADLAIEAEGSLILPPALKLHLRRSPKTAPRSFLNGLIPLQSRQQEGEAAVPNTEPGAQGLSPSTSWNHLQGVRFLPLTFPPHPTEPGTRNEHREPDRSC